MRIPPRLRAAGPEPWSSHPLALSEPRGATLLIGLDRLIMVIHLAAEGLSKLLQSEGLLQGSVSRLVEKPSTELDRVGRRCGRDFPCKLQCGGSDVALRY